MELEILEKLQIFNTRNFSINEFINYLNIFSFNFPNNMKKIKLIDMSGEIFYDGLLINVLCPWAFKHSKKISYKFFINNNIISYDNLFDAIVQLDWHLTWTEDIYPTIQIMRVAEINNNFYNHANFIPLPPSKTEITNYICTYLKFKNIEIVMIMIGTTYCQYPKYLIPLECYNKDSINKSNYDVIEHINDIIHLQFICK
jgi:hypothetical protein